MSIAPPNPIPVDYPILPPEWATRFGSDRFGVFAAFEVDNVEFLLRWIPPGTFWMGSPDDELGENEPKWVERERPQHQVLITQGFWLGETPVTQEQWQAIAAEGLESNPGGFPGDNHPVEQVNWSDCQKWLKHANEQIPGLVADFPTEAQWEYACRAGHQSAFNDGSSCTEPLGLDPALNELGWFNENSQTESGAKGTHPVGQKKPNRWGLYDMHGNVWEWCRDAMLRKYTEQSVTDPFEDDSANDDNRARRVVRGGSWIISAGFCRSAYRFWRHPVLRFQNRGFRLSAGQRAEPEATE